MDFKLYTMAQLQLSTNLETLIPPNHLARVVHDAIEKMDLSPLLKHYIGGGTSSCHPKMMLKVLVYAYIQRIYSSRKIPKSHWESPESPHQKGSEMKHGPSKIIPCGIPG
jgi:transposase